MPANIFYHLVTALMQYLDKTEGAVVHSLAVPGVAAVAEPAEPARPALRVIA